MLLADSGFDAWRVPLIPKFASERAA